MLILISANHPIPHPKRPPFPFPVNKCPTWARSHPEIPESTWSTLFTLFTLCLSFDNSLVHRVHLSYSITYQVSPAVDKLTLISLSVSLSRHDITLSSKTSWSSKSPVVYSFTSVAARHRSSSSRPLEMYPPHPRSSSLNGWLTRPLGPLLSSYSLFELRSCSTGLLVAVHKLDRSSTTHSLAILPAVPTGPTTQTSERYKVLYISSHIMSLIQASSSSSVHQRHILLTLPPSFKSLHSLVQSKLKIRHHALCTMYCRPCWRCLLRPSNDRPR